MGTAYKELFKLYDMIQSGDTRSVQRFLVENPLNINVIIPCKGIGVLHLAVGIEPVDKSRECTELILKHGGDPNLWNSDRITPVHIAAIWGRTENLKLLVGCGGDPYLRDFEGQSAFDYAAREQQWDVYDYLHNVVDTLDDSFGPNCAYTLDLDKVLFVTDSVVAEYEPVDEDKMNNIAYCRKSEMVREWCDKTSLIMNKLYPTIIGEMALLENESEPWKDIELTEFNLTEDQSANETLSSYKTCLTRKFTPMEISGVKPLEKTIDLTQNNDLCSAKHTSDYFNNLDLRGDSGFGKSKKTVDSTEESGHSRSKQRLSVYENFSLPGSPNSITHVNYKSKSSIRKKNKDKTECICCDLNKKLVIDDYKSLMTEDLCLDKANAVLQNKTNEWLTSCRNDEDCSVMNTRRSSASSGVSSHLSGGSIAIASVHEDYRYEDKEEDVVLIERRLLVSSVVLPVDDATEQSLEQTIVSVASSLPPSVEYDNNTLRAELIRLGFNPGPILNSTKTLYLKKLHALKKNPIVVTNQGKSFSIELEKSLRTDDWMKNLTFYIELESKAREDFANSNKKWREGCAKTSFTYLLMDPRLTANLPAKATKQSQHVSWVTFVNSIFYVGKGKRSRPYSHLYQAQNLWKHGFTTSNDKKVQHILDIWSEKLGVVCLHIFQNVIPAEAYTYEAAMIDVIGLTNLRNLKCGNYYGAVSSWSLKERRMLGLYLLYKAMLIFLSEGERQLRPEDID